MNAQNQTVNIRTSKKNWFKELVLAYRDQVPIFLVDDAEVGITPETQTLLEIGRDMGLTKEDWIGILVALGVSAVGVGLIVAAIFDPEPTSKLGLLVSGGITFVFSGGFMAIKLLTRQKPPTVKMGKDGIQIDWT